MRPSDMRWVLVDELGELRRFATRNAAYRALGLNPDDAMPDDLELKQLPKPAFDWSDEAVF